MYSLTIATEVVDVYCDMTTDGGGWMLVLNYFHRGQTNPELFVRNTTTGFPLLKATTIGTDESWLCSQRGSWGHLDPSFLSQVRFYPLMLH